MRGEFYKIGLHGKRSSRTILNISLNERKEKDYLILK